MVLHLGRTAFAAVMVAAAMTTPLGADQLVNPQPFGTNPGLPVIQLPTGLDGTGRIPDCSIRGCVPGGFGSSGKAGVRDFYRDLRPDMRGQTRFRSPDDYRLPETGYRQPDAYIDLDVGQARYATPPAAAPRAIDGNPAISGTGPENPKPHVDWCLNRYRSYRAADDTFQPFQGPRRRCNSPFG